MFRRLIPLFLALLLALPALAQDQAALVADRIAVENGTTLQASGNVEVLYQGSRLKASAISFDRERNVLSITGPMSLTNEDGSVIFLASAAT